MTMRLLSWNVWGGLFLPVITGYLRHAKADIIALQEVEEQGEDAYNQSIRPYERIDKNSS